MEFIGSNDGPWVFGDIKCSWRIEEGPHAAAQLAASDRMIRPRDYWRVWSDLEETRALHKLRVHGFLITGHPGIGKTHLLDVLLAASLHKYPNVPVIAISRGRTQLFTNLLGDDQKRYSVDILPGLEGALVDQLSELCLRRETRLLVLHDIRSAQGYQSTLVECLSDRFYTTCVAVSTPNRSHYNEFLKSCGGLTYHLPVLSKDEARAFVERFAPHSSAIFEKQFADVGGVPRHLLLESDALEMALRHQQEAAGTIQFGSSSLSSIDMWHSIFLSVVRADGRGVLAYDFVSDRACQRWLDRQTLETLEHAVESARKMYDKETVGSVVRRMYKQALVLNLQKHRPLSYSKLSPTPQPLMPFTSPMLLKGIRSTTSMGATVTPALHLPMEGERFPVADAVIAEALRDETTDEETGTEEEGILAVNKERPGAKVTILRVAIDKGPHDEELLPSVAEAEKLFKMLDDNNVQPVSVVWVVNHASGVTTRRELQEASLGERSADPRTAATLERWRNLEQYVCPWDFHMCWVRNRRDQVVGFPVPHTDLGAQAILGEIKMHVDTSATKIANFSDADGTPKAPYSYE